jgi:hypothetical protein
LIQKIDNVIERNKIVDIVTESVIKPVQERKTQAVEVAEQSKQYAVEVAEHSKQFVEQRKQYVQKHAVDTMNNAIHKAEQVIDSYLPAVETAAEVPSSSPDKEAIRVSRKLKSRVQTRVSNVCTYGSARVHDAVHILHEKTEHREEFLTTVFAKLLSYIPSPEATDKFLNQLKESAPERAKETVSTGINIIAPFIAHTFLFVYTLGLALQNAVIGVKAQPAVVVVVAAQTQTQAQAPVVTPLATPAAKSVEVAPPAVTEVVVVATAAAAEAAAQVVSEAASETGEDNQGTSDEVSEEAAPKKKSSRKQQK